jgi:hypothetical protein
MAFGRQVGDGRDRIAMGEVQRGSGGGFFDLHEHSERGKARQQTLEVFFSK